MKSHSVFRYNFGELGLTCSTIEEIIGYEAGEDREFIRGMINEILSECRTIADVKAEYRIFEHVSFQEQEKIMTVEDISFDVKRIVFSQLKKSTSAALFICTAGDEIGIRSREAMNGRDFLRGYILDVAGSEIVEAAADMMQNALEKEAFLSGQLITNRYSPGYCGWNVSEQHKFFSFFPDNHCGIKLTPSALMQPEKSVSGIIGIGEDVKKSKYICSMCDFKDCIYRRVREGRR